MQSLRRSSGRVLPGDLVFIFLGALLILIAVGPGYLSPWLEWPRAGATHPVRAA